MKITGIILLMTFFLLLAVSIIKSKKDEISYLDDLIYFYNQLIIILSNTAPDTDYIFSKLSQDARLSKYDLKHIDNYYSVNSNIKNKIGESVDALGKYSADTQIKYFSECAEYFKELKLQKQSLIDKNKKLYFAICMSIGFTISLFVI